MDLLQCTFSMYVGLAIHVGSMHSMHSYYVCLCVHVHVCVYMYINKETWEGYREREGKGRKRVEKERVQE